MYIIIIFPDSIYCNKLLKRTVQWETCTTLSEDLRGNLCIKMWLGVGWEYFKALQRHYFWIIDSSLYISPTELKNIGVLIVLQWRMFDKSWYIVEDSTRMPVRGDLLKETISKLVMLNYYREVVAKFRYHQVNYSVYTSHGILYHEKYVTVNFVHRLVSWGHLSVGPRWSCPVSWGRSRRPKGCCK